MARAVAVSVLLLLAVLWVGVASAAEGGEEPFAVVLQPDTQFLTENRDGTQLGAWLEGLRWVCAQRDARRIRGFLTLGDLVQGANDEAQWRNWRKGIAVVEGCGIPILATIGNHDFPCNPEGQTRCGNLAVDPKDSNFRGAAPRFAANAIAVMDASGAPWWGGRGPRLTDPACTATPDASRAAWIHLGPGWGALALPWNDGDADTASRATSCESMWAWARSVLEAHPDTNFFVVGHRVVDPTGLVTGRVRDVRPLVADHPNAVAVAGGHWLPPRRFASRTQTLGGTGRAVVFANFQTPDPASPYFGGLVIATVDPAAGTICYRSYSPHRDAYDLQGIGQVCHRVDLRRGGGP